MRKPTEEDIRKRLREGIDYEWYRSKWREMGYAFGERWNRTFQSIMSAGEFPRYPDVVPSLREIGRSRRMMNTAAIALAENMYANPQPSFPTLGRVKTEVRQSYWDDRFRLGEFGPEFASAFMDADACGLGFMRIYPEDIEGGTVCRMEHVPLLQTIWDRHARQPSKMRWVAFALHLAPEDADAMFPGKGVLGYQDLMLESSISIQPVNMVRIIDYWSYGVEGEEPTHSVFLQDISGPKLLQEKNPYPCLPATFCENYLFPGVRRPVGRLFLQLPVAEQISELHRILRRNMKVGSAATGIDPSKVDPNDARQVFSGEGDGVLKIKGGFAVPALERYPAQEVDKSVLALINLMDREYDEAAGMTNVERSQEPAPETTLGQTEIQVNASQRRGSWQTKKILEFYSRSMERFFKIAALCDTAPITISITGGSFDANVKGKNASKISHWLSEDAPVEIGQDALAVTDSQADRARRIQELNAMAPYVEPRGPISITWIAKEYLKATGTLDPSEALVEVQSSLGQVNSGMPGVQPGMMPQSPAAPSPNSGLPPAM